MCYCRTISIEFYTWYSDYSRKCRDVYHVRFGHGEYNVPVLHV